jgi:hypothetical protein
MGRSRKGSVFKYQASIPGDDDNDDDDYFEDYYSSSEFTTKTTSQPTTAGLMFGRGKRQDNLPAYCARKPMLVNPSPLAGETIIVMGSIALKLKAETTNGDITRFQYNSPMGMKCTKVGGDFCFV